MTTGERSLPQPGHRPGPSHRALVALALSAAALLATSQALPSTNAELTMPLDLDPDTAVAWPVELAVEPGRMPIFDVGLHAVASIAGAEVIPSVTDVALTVLPPDLPDVWPHDDGFGGTGVDLTQGCLVGCAGSAWIIARSTGQDRSEADTLTTIVTVQGDGDPSEVLDASVTLEHGDGPERAEAGSVARDAVRVVTTGSPDGSEAPLRVRLRVPAAALVGPLQFPLVGRLSVRGDTTSTLGAYTYLQVHGTTESIFTPGDRWTDVDWLDHCTTGRDCEVVIDVFSAIDTSAYDGEVPGDLEANWEILASLEAFDGRDLPAEAVTLTVDD